jgi:hypothetical protein
VLIKRSDWLRPPTAFLRPDFGRLFKYREVTEILAPAVYGLRYGGKSGLRTRYSIGSSVSLTSKGKLGKCATFSDSNSWIQLASDADTLLGTTRCTILVLRSLNSTSFSATQSHGYTAGDTDRVAVHFPYTDGNVYWDYGNFFTNTGGGRLVATTSGTWVAGKIEAWAFIADPTRGREIWRDGVRIANHTGRTASRNTTSQAFRVGAAAGSAQPENVFQFVLLGDTALDADRIEAWSENPWRIFTPRLRSIFVGSALVEASGSSAVSGLGEVVASALKTALAAALVATSGAVAASGVKSVSGSASCSGKGSVSATAAKVVARTAAVSNAGLVEASGRKVGISAASVSDSGSTAVLGSKLGIGSAAVSGSGSTNVSGTIAETAIGSSGVTGYGGVSASGRKVALASGSVSASGALASTGRKRGISISAVSGWGVSSSRGVVPPPARPVLPGYEIVPEFFDEDDDARVSEFFEDNDVATDAFYNGTTTLRVIFDRDYVEALGIAGTGPAALVETAALPHANPNGRSLVVAGTTFTIRRFEPLDDGATTQLHLEVA